MEPVQGLHKMEKYAWVCRIWRGRSGIIHKMRDRLTQELVAVKFIKRGDMVSKHVEEILNHRSLAHPHIVRFKEITATPSHLGMVMEFFGRSLGGTPELLSRLGLPVSEDMARFLFQQLISGVSYSHSKQVVCHRDLRPHHFLIGTARNVKIPYLKICDFSSSIIHQLRPDDPSPCPSLPDGAAAYMAPEVWRSHIDFGKYQGDYDGCSADVWSCGVTLYRLLVGCYPFGSPTDENTPVSTIKCVLEVEYSIPDHVKCVLEAEYSIPDYVHISPNGRDLLSRMLVADPAKRITIPDIEEHTWYQSLFPLQNLAKVEVYKFGDTSPPQTLQEVLRIIGECKIAPTI